MERDLKFQFLTGASSFSRLTRARLPRPVNHFTASLDCLLLTFFTIIQCSVCSSTLSLNSVYVSVASGAKKIYCKVDVPRAVHTAVVDSVALRRALSAPKADLNKGTTALNGGKMGSMRFKGLTLRSKGMRSGLDAPKIDVETGVNRVGVRRSQSRHLSVADSPSNRSSSETLEA